MASKSAPQSARHQKLWLGLLILLTIIVLAPQLSQIRRSVVVLQTVNSGLIGLALVAVATTFFLAASSYHCLARNQLQFHRTVLVALANMFTNRLLPAGAGSIATFYNYLRQHKHTQSQAGSVIAINNLLGSITHGLLLLLLFLITPASFVSFIFPPVDARLATAVLLCVAVIIVIVSSRKSWHRKSSDFFKRLKKDLRIYRQHPIKLFGASTAAVALTLCNAAALWFCALAVGAQIGPVVALAVFTIGVVAGTATPTPGGIGGAEAGLLAALIGFRVPTEIALATIIAYRLVSYWLPLVAGSITYFYVRGRGYFGPVR